MNDVLRKIQLMGIVPVVKLDDARMRYPWQRPCVTVGFPVQR